MSETYTPPQTPQSEFDKHSQEAFELANSTPDNTVDELAFFNEAAAAAAKRIEINVAQETTNTSQDIPVHHTPSKKLGTKIVAGVSIAAAAVTGGAIVNEVFGPTEFSEDTATYTVNHNNGLLDVAQQVKGVDERNIQDAVQHIKNDPANIDVLSNGFLDPGEQVTYPISTADYENKNKN